MRENSNRSIAVNTAVLYARLAIVSVCGLLYTRFGLKALGADDYGLFAVVGGMVALMALANSVMVSVSNRFIAVAIGRGDEEETAKTFSVNLSVHVLIAVLTLALALPLGHWYIARYVNYAGPMENVYWICDVSVAAAALSFVGVPYNGLLLARERFFVYCSTDAGAALLKLLVTWLLVGHFEHKLLIYAATMAFMTAYPTLVFALYCRRHFPAVTRPRLVRDWSAYRRVLRFSAGVGIGTLMGMTKLQGTQLIANVFFGTVANSALAVANAVNQLIQMFASNISKSVSPQIYKSCAAGDERRYTYLVCLSSRLTYLVMLTVSLPFLLIPETLFGLWLEEVPPGTLSFSRLMILDILVLSLNSGIVDVIFASGRIYLYQTVVNAIVALSIAAGFLAVRGGARAEWLFYCYLTSSAVIFFVRPLIMTRVVRFDARTLVRESYLPVLAVTLLMLPLYLLRPLMSPWALAAAAAAWYVPVVWAAGLRRDERTRIKALLHDRLRLPRR